MPFNPDEYLAKKQAKQPASGTASGFDPSAYLTSKGVNTLPDNGNIPSGPSQGEAFARGAAQGATFSFGDELTSGVDAAVEKARELATGNTSLAPGGSLGDKYDAAKEQNRAVNKAAADAHPYTDIGGQIVGGLPAAIASGGSSLLTQAATGAGIGALNSLGSSENQTSEDALKNAAGSGGIAGGLALLLGGSARLVTKGISKLLESPLKAGSMAYNLSKTLTNPQVAQQIGQEIDNTGAQFAKLSQEARATIGQNLDSIASRTNAKVNPNNVIKNVVDQLDAYNPGRNALAQGAKSDLKDAIKNISEDLLKSADKDGKVNFSDLHKLKQTLSQTVFEQGLYQDSKYVDKLAKQLYSGVANTLKSADASGEYANLSKVYQTLSSSDPEAFSANALKYLQDPWDVSSRGRLARLLGDMQTMGTDLKNTYIPKLAHFIDNEFQNAAVKAEILKKVGGKNGALVLKGVSLPNPSAIASDIGAGLAPLKPAINGISRASQGLRSLVPIEGPIAGPAAGGFSTVTSSQLGNALSK